MNETVDLVHAFAKEQLTKEVVEFRADRQAMSAKVSEVDQFIKETLTKELEGFHEDRRRLVEDRINLKINAGKELAEAKKKMISEMASVSGKFIKNILAEEIVQLKGELIEAKKKHFGKKLFEAFAAEFGSSFFNERKEMKKLFKVIEETNKKLEETKNEIVKRDAIISEERNKLRIIEDRFTRTKTMNEMCGTLAGSKRKLMEELLEKVPTNKLTESFKAYLPSVISAETSKKTELKEGRISEVTGDKDNLMSKAAKEAPEKTAINEVLGSFRKMENYANTKGTF